MKYINTGVYDEIVQFTSLVPFSKDYDLTKFDCGLEDYNHFLVHDATYYIKEGISSVHLLIQHDTKEIIGYIALLADAFILDKTEKEKLNLTVHFSSVPALKIGKLATSKHHKNYPYGSYLLYISLGFARELEELGIACRFLTVDADIEFNKDTPKFYQQNGFVKNEHVQMKRKKSVSMRYDLFNE